MMEDDSCYQTIFQENGPRPSPSHAQSQVDISKVADDLSSQQVRVNSV